MSRTWWSNSMSLRRPATSGLPAGGRRARRGLCDRPSRAHRPWQDSDVARSGGAGAALAAETGPRQDRTSWSDCHPRPCMRCCAPWHAPAGLAGPAYRPVDFPVRARRPGELLHVDARRSASSAPSAAGTPTAATHSSTSIVAGSCGGARVGLDYVHCAIDDHTGSPTPRSIPTRPQPPAPRSFARPPPGCPPSASTESNAS